MIDMDLRPMLPKITAPTLVIGGDEDIMTPWQQAESGAGQEYLCATHQRRKEICD
jgi:pimeloyl-ACP methyl ester carboxylesterase